ncbi:hypothetical protein Pse7367_0395 [Thalassoporum mexicanum PCC 7367]|uniref:hypothetical protein n=1 Tax=Thalassoporum mexicanum TaxID=3457544 RepID=UPI00029FAB2E|nr:hypothetical protein [Pseudanabaena sp. PCC 7367]AFY68706.1 hypothetical protein Pse7367_0395 [Pseudanabaena sp. PCC 7367]
MKKLKIAAIALIINTLAIASAPAQTSSPLNRALCAKDWNTAISIATRQINATTKPTTKQQWQDYRDRLIAVSRGRLTFSDSEFAQLGCPQTSLNAPLPTFEFRVQTQTDGTVRLNSIGSRYNNNSFAGQVQNPHDFKVRNAKVHYRVTTREGIYERTTSLRPSTIMPKQKAAFSQSFSRDRHVLRVMVTKITADPAITPRRAASKRGDCTCPYDIAASGDVCGYQSDYFLVRQTSDACYR